MNKQTGSIHAIIIGVLTVGSISAVGFIFWQNFIDKDQATKAEDLSTSIKKDVNKPSIAKKTYCAEYEKLCFDYPGDWTIKRIKEDRVVADNVTVTSAEKDVVMQLSTGMGSQGGAYGNVPEGPVTVLSVVSAPKIGTMDVNYHGGDFSDQYTDEAYVSEVITSKVEAEYEQAEYESEILMTKILGYYPVIALHNSVQLSTNNSFLWTEGSLSMRGSAYGLDHIPGKYSGKFDKATISFGTSPHYSYLKPFATVEKARAQLKSPSFQQAKEILLSARYK